MDRFTVQKLNRNDHSHTGIWASIVKVIFMPIRILASIVDVMLTPIFLLVRLYCWVWDYDYCDRFKRW